MIKCQSCKHLKREPYGSSCHRMIFGKRFNPKDWEVKELNDCKDYESENKDLGDYE